MDVIDADPEARERTVRVKLLAPVQPVPPQAVGGAVPAGGVRGPDRHPVRGDHGVGAVAVGVVVPGHGDAGAGPGPAGWRNGKAG